ncbi:hypothetical protein TNCV_2258401 [Trichonephila clavipes]|nr:hypothetical protein TNCV_2258401 [Trichonephila clavipes]
MSNCRKEAACFDWFRHCISYFRHIVWVQVLNQVKQTINLFPNEELIWLPGLDAFGDVLSFAIPNIRGNNSKPFWCSKRNRSHQIFPIEPGRYYKRKGKGEGDLYYIWLQGHSIGSHRSGNETTCHRGWRFQGFVLIYYKYESYGEDITVSKLNVLDIQTRTRLKNSQKLSDGSQLGKGKVDRLGDDLVIPLRLLYDTVKQNITLSDVKAVWAVYFHIRSAFGEEPFTVLSHRSHNSFEQISKSN